MPRIQVWSSNIGGHSRIAEAVKRAVEQQQPGAQVEITDVYGPDFLHGTFSRFTNAYDSLVALWRPAWGTAYHLSNRPSFMRLVRRVGAALTRRSALRPLLGSERPDLIVRVISDAGQLAALERLAARRGQPLPPVVVVISDLVSIHPGWLTRPTDYYLVPTDEALAACLAQGVRPECVERVGFPIRAHRFCPDGAPTARRRDGHAPGGRLRVLVMGGTSGSGHIVDDVQALLSAGLPLDLTVVTGRNQRLHRRLSAMAQQQASRPAQMKVLHYTDDIPELMRASDLLISKAGPGTIYEAIVTGLPALLNGYLPGQEEGNIEYFTQAGVALPARSPAETLALVRGFAADPARLAGLRNLALADETCRATPRIAEYILEKAGA